MLKTQNHPREIYQKSKEFGIENSAKMLTDIIDKEKDNTKRKDAIKYLGLIIMDSKTLKDEYFEIFENLIISDDKIEIKCEATKALGRIKHQRALKLLKWLLEQESVNNKVKLSALKAIRKICFNEPEIRLFINELNNKFNSIKECVSNELLSLKPEKLINLLIESLKEKNYSNSHKAEILRLIGYKISRFSVSSEDNSFIKTKYPLIYSNLINNKIEILKTTIYILKEEDSTLMESILTIFTLLKSELEDDIIKLLLIDDFIARKNASILCGKLKLKSAVILLIANLDNMYNEVTIAAIEALAEIGDLSAVPELLDILNIEDVSFEYTDLDMKLYIVDAIKRIYQYNPNVSYEYLYNSLNKENNAIKESIAFIFGELGKNEFVKSLCELLDLRNLEVRKNAIIALGKIGSIEPLEDLIRIIKDNSTYWLIKKVAVDAIYNIYQNNWYKVRDGKQEISRILNKNSVILADYLKVQDSENYKIKLSLIKLLENFGDQKILTSLITKVNDFHRVVRIYASNAIKRIEERLETKQF
ncbi:MAG: HEAT repeat domain-containing protein [Candidatus Odinarchaeota archaeon]